MLPRHRINIYIDANNLHRGAISLGFEINYKKFRGWLGQKFEASNIYMFIGFLEKNLDLYEAFRSYGFILIFKKTVLMKNSIKGNCDAELVLNVISDFYTKSFDSCYLITGDGDFDCLVEFLQKNNVLRGVISPGFKRSSILLMNNKDIKIIFLDNLYHKFSTKIISLNKKTPDADASA